MPERIQRKRTKGWRMPDGTVYVGRPTLWGNPFVIGRSFCGPTIETLYSPGQLVKAFRLWISHDTLHPHFWDSDLISAHVRIKAALATGELAGKNLACWCPLDQPCHADVLLEIANG